MRYSKAFLKRLISAARVVSEHELTCDECWDQLDRFAEAELAGRNAEEILPLVALHLSICPACKEEYRALVEAVRATGIERSLLHGGRR